MFAVKDHLWTIFYICVMLKLYGVAQVMKTRYDERPPPLNISHDLSSVIHGDNLHVVDRENVSLVAPFSPQLKFSGISELKLAPDRES